MRRSSMPSFLRTHITEGDESLAEDLLTKLLGDHKFESS